MGKQTCFFLWISSFCLYWFLNKMANSFKTLNLNDQILPALPVKFALISGCILFWTDVLIQVHGILTNKALTLSKLKPQSGSLRSNTQKEIKVKTKQLSFRNQEKKWLDFMDPEMITPGNNGLGCWEHGISWIVVKQVKALLRSLTNELGSWEVLRDPGSFPFSFFHPRPGHQSQACHFMFQDGCCISRYHADIPEEEKRKAT